MDRLDVLAGLKTTRDRDVAADADFRNNWDTVKAWDESSRYLRIARVKAEELFDAVTDKKHGVMLWIRLHW